MRKLVIFSIAMMLVVLGYAQETAKNESKPTKAKTEKPQQATTVEVETFDFDALIAEVEEENAQLGKENARLKKENDETAARIAKKKEAGELIRHLADGISLLAEDIKQKKSDD